jgi:hypothetical protein
MRLPSRMPLDFWGIPVSPAMAVDYEGESLMKILRLIAVFFCMSLTPSLYAQLGLYGTFTTAKLNVTNYDNWLYGATFGAYLASGRLAFFSVGVDGRGSLDSRGPTGFYSGGIGPRVSLNTHILPISPYVEATAGVGHATFSQGTPSSVTKFEYQFLGGLEYTVLPRVDWRVAEFSYGGLTGLNSYSFHPKTISSGVVLRLPRILPLP